MRAARPMNFRLIKQFGLYSVFFLSFIFIYKIYITDLYGYMGYVDELSVSNFPLSFMAIAFCIVLADRPQKPSGLFLHFALATIVLPSMVLYCAASLPFYYYFTVVSGFAVMAVASRWVTMPRVVIFDRVNVDWLRIFVVISVSSVAAILMLGGARYLNFDLSAVYDFREDAAKNLPAIFHYIDPVVGKVVIPFGMVFSVLARRWIYALVFTGCSVLLFSLTANKALLFYPAIVFIVYRISESTAVIKYFLLALIFGLVIAGVDFYYFDVNSGTPWFGNLFVRRALLMPSMLNWFYLDWFSRNDFYYWADSKLSFGLVNAPNSLRFVNLIGSEYLGGENTSANVGWLGSGYANAGLMGVYLYSFLTGLIFSHLNSYAKKMGSKLIVSLFAVPVLTILTSTDLLTIFLTHGFLFALIVIGLVKPTTDKRPMAT
ncbi:hypothetical protein [Variovorax sp. Varisp36]|uniref:hypothetical protein n=1 Tax=Variovorax sp. Varisp36 TaxID=3243031 RepID=UPI0039A40737